MVKKISLIFILMFLFIPTCFGATVEDLNTSLDNRWLGKESMRNILTELNLTVTEENLTAYTYQFNEWFKTVEDETVTLKNIVFYKFSNYTNLYWVVGNGSFSNTLDYLYCRMVYFGDNSNSSEIRFKKFINWNYNSSGSINGVEQEDTKYYYCNNKNYGATTDITRACPVTGTIELENVYCDQVVTPLSTYAVYGYTAEFGYKTYFLTHTYELAKTEEEEPITSGDTESGDIGGGTDGSTNYPDYNEKLDNIQTGIGNVNNNLENIGNQIESGNKEVVGAVGEIKDFLSGEATITDSEILEKFPEANIDDPSEDFFSWIFSQLENVFLSTEPQTFEFSLYTDKKYSISSEQIKVPENAIKTLIALSTSFGIFYWILKDVRKTINKVKEGSIEALATEDITADMV